ncbi:helix-turn-helix domain-containing protein [Rhizobium bangladeshense]|uniref:helix-turn-helix domain-containing protein n=1 Tax=Rhizobium bangladeshense TaxID=1138189 RepID=UPI001C92AE41|nr:helix-turn-helix domain-containing protein [Rhizobium bangladeshense]MBY3582236.1 helix-turn-helix domain-containing protein [Rhizobium bangladeshense]
MSTKASNEEKTLASDLSQQIRRARKRLKMNQAQFAHALEASQGSVSKWESGREAPRLETLKKIAQLVPEFRIIEDEDRHSGFLAPLPDLAEGEHPVIKSVPIKGLFKDGRPLQRYDVSKLPEGKYLDLGILFTPEWEDKPMEAWFLQSRYDSLMGRERPTAIGIFALMSDLDRADDSRLFSEFLVGIAGEDKSERMFLMNLQGGRPSLALWPTSDAGRIHTMPIPLSAEGKPIMPGVTVYATLVAKVVYSGTSTSDALEPQEF